MSVKRKTHRGSVTKTWSGTVALNAGQGTVTFQGNNDTELRKKINSAAGSDCRFAPPDQNGVVFIYNALVQEKMGEFTDDTPIGFMHSALVPDELAYEEQLQSLKPIEAAA